MPPAGPTIAAALAQAQAAGVDRLSAQRLLAHVLERPREWLLAHDDQALQPAQAQRFAQGCLQRADGVPLAYLLGEREFHGLSLRITPDVLDPRPDTETLVDWALEALQYEAPDTSVLDLGTGSGAIALALATEASRRGVAWRVHASDASAAALAVAQANAQHLGLAVRWAAGSWWQAWPGQRFALVVSNPPYIADADPHLDALRHEPAMALVSGADGLDAIRNIIAGAAAHLLPGGALLLEHGWQQAEAVAALLLGAGFGPVQHRRDLAGHLRCTGARLP